MKYKLLKIFVVTIGLISSIFGLISCSKSVTNLYLNYSQNEIKVGETATPILTGSPISVKIGKVIYTSSDPLIATVNDSGVVTGVGGGEITITVKLASKPKVSGVSPTIKVTALDPAKVLTGFTLSYSKTILRVNDTIQPTIKPIPLTAPLGSVTYESSNTTIATVNATGYITAKSPGDFTITVRSATNPDIKGTTIILTVSHSLDIVSLSLSYPKQSIFIGEQQTPIFSSEPSLQDFSLVTFYSNNTKVVTVGPTGVITGVRTGQAVITVRSNDNIGVTSSFIVYVNTPDFISARGLIETRSSVKELAIKIKTLGGGVDGNAALINERYQKAVQDGYAYILGTKANYTQSISEALTLLSTYNLKSDVISYIEYTVSDYLLPPQIPPILGYEKSQVIGVDTQDIYEDNIENPIHNTTKYFLTAWDGGKWVLISQVKKVSFTLLDALLDKIADEKNSYQSNIPLNSTISHNVANPATYSTITITSELVNYSLSEYMSTFEESELYLVSVVSNNQTKKYLYLSVYDYVKEAYFIDKIIKLESYFSSLSSLYSYYQVVSTPYSEEIPIGTLFQLPSYISFYAYASNQTYIISKTPTITNPEWISLYSTYPSILNNAGKLEVDGSDLILIVGSTEQKYYVLGYLLINKTNDIVSIPSDTLSFESWFSLQ